MTDDSNDEFSIEDLTIRDINKVSEERLSDTDKLAPHACRKIAFRWAVFRCRLCGEKDIRVGGNQFLHTHHVEDSPANYLYHHPRNLTVLCSSCHHLFHSATKPDDLSSNTADLIAGQNLDSNWLEILRVIDEHGPCTPADIQQGVSLSSAPGVRDTLYRLMSLDQRESGPDQQILVQNHLTGEYGLPSQVPPEDRTRGTVPDDREELERRVRDDVVSRLDQHIPQQLHKRKLISAIVDQYTHHTYSVQYRARARGFPLESWLRGEIDGWSQRDAHELLTSVITIPDDWDVDLVMVLDSIYATFEQRASTALATDTALSARIPDAQDSISSGDAD